MKGRVYTVVILLLIGLISLGIWIFNHQQHPENAILGTWKEEHWVYAKVDGKQKGTMKKISSGERYEIANHLVIHAFENWTFSKDRTLRLHEQDGQEHMATWSLSGRGHMLRIHNPDGSQEVYQIETLNKRRLVLHFETNVHARGIVKITFKR